MLLGSHTVLELKIRYSLVVLDKQVNGIINGLSASNELVIVVGEVLVEFDNVIVEFIHIEFGL